MIGSVFRSLRPWLLAAVVATSMSLRAQEAGSLRITNFSRTGGWALGWEHSATGMAYTVQFQETLQDGIWRLPGWDMPYPLASNRWFDAVGTNSMAFYRVLGVPAAQRGKVLSTSLVTTLSQSLLTSLFIANKIPISPLYNVRMYKMTYETVTPWGARVQASGALLLPENVGQPLPLLSYQHGTLTRTNDAPSSMSLFGEAMIGVAFASTGYAALVPDYLGLGSSSGLHPYHHARSEATACIDMLRAARTFCPANGFGLTNRLFLCGYSQGGHATMALFRELETLYTNEFAVTACAPMAGAYDLSTTTTADFLSGRTLPNPYYFLYILAAYQDVYHLAPTLADLLTPPYNTTLPPLLDGNSTGSQMNAAMPADPTLILKPEFLAALRSDPRSPIHLALRDNDLIRWRPRAPLRLYHCAGDQDVVFANSQVALASFQSLGATQVELKDPAPSADHGGCVQPSLLAAKTWFDTLR